MARRKKRGASARELDLLLRSHGHDDAHPPLQARRHSHPHDPEHPHPHGHDDLPGRPARAHRDPADLARAREEAEHHRAPLTAGAGVGKTLFLDAASGIAGDMTIGALVDLGVPFAVVEGAVALLPLRGVELVLEPARAGAIGASRFDVRAHGKQPERRYREIDRMLERAALPVPVKELSRRIFRKLGEAEAEVHRIPLAEVQFHEVGSVDAIVDVVGAAACFAFLGARVLCTPLPLGPGFVDCRHGRLPLPAPATVSALRGVPTYDSGIDVELVTPTGAAIAATVAQGFVRWPSIVPERIGWGAGARPLPDRPNALRAVLGAPAPAAEAGAPGAAPSHVVVEANLDDATGELVGHAIAALLAQGALDAWATPVTMKKGRPGVVLSALGRLVETERLAEIVLRETSSIGVRHSPVSRVERPRETRVVSTSYGAIPVKVSAGPYGAPVVKPEFDACVEAAARAGVAVRVVIAAALGEGDAKEARRKRR